MTKITEENKEYYIEYNGNSCPYCRSTNITTTELPDAYDGYAWQECRCWKCGKRWRDVYTLTEVEEVEVE